MKKKLEKIYDNLWASWRTICVLVKHRFDTKAAKAEAVEELAKVTEKLKRLEKERDGKARA